MYISYSGWALFDSCQFGYWNSYINNTAVEGLVDDRLGSIYGSVVGRLVEHFYNRELYRKDGPQFEMQNLVDEVIEEVIQEAISDTKYRKGGVLLWKGPAPTGNPKALYANKAALAADVRDTIPRICRIIREERLLGPGARAEVKLDCDIEGHRIAGRADFVMRRVRPHSDLIIVDGKGSQWGAKYVDLRQLVWYSWLYQQLHGVLPDRVAFVFWRFDPPEHVAWTEVSKSAVDDLATKVLADLRRISTQPKIETFESARKVFLPIATSALTAKPNKPEPSASTEEVQSAYGACRFCNYALEGICPDGTRLKALVEDAKKSKNRKKNAKVEPLV